MAGFRYFTNTPCPVCGDSSGDCRESYANGLVYCHKSRDEFCLAPGYRFIKLVGGSSAGTDWGLWAEEGWGRSNRRGGEGDDEPAAASMGRRKRPAPTDRKYRWLLGISRPMRPAEAEEFARHLGLPVDAVARHYQIAPVVDDPQWEPDDPRIRHAYTMPEWGFGEDGKPAHAGLHRRDRDGTKKTYGSHLCPGGNHGLFIPDGWLQLDGPLYVFEGATDTLAAWSMGVPSLGRFSNKGGAEVLARLLAGADWPAGRDVVVVGENDQKPDGRWPGREGAFHVARELVRRLGRPVKVAFPPDGYKDARDWFKAHWKPGADPKQLAERFRKDFGGCVQVIRPEHLERERLSAQAAVCAAAAVTAGVEEADLKALAGHLAGVLREAAAARRAQEGEAAAAEAIARMRRDGEEYRCRRPRCVALGHKPTGDVLLHDVRCEKWDAVGCRACRRFLVDRELTNAATRFKEAGQVYEFGCSEGQFVAMRQRVRRAGGEYLRCVDGEGYYVVCSVPVDGAIPCTLGTAVSTLETLLREHPPWCGERPVSTSRGWKLPQREGSGEFEVIGLVDAHLPSQTLHDICDRHQVEVKHVTPATAPRDRTQRMRKLTGFRDDEHRRQVMLDLYCGGAVGGGDLPAIRFKKKAPPPPPTPTPVAVAPDVADPDIWVPW